MAEISTSDKLRGISLFAAWLIVWVIIQCWLLWYYGISLKLSFLDALLTQSCLLLDAYVEIMMVRYYRPTGKNSIYLLASSAALSAFFVSILNWMLKNFTDDETYLQMLGSTLVIRFLFVWLMMVLIGAGGWLWFYWREQDVDKQQVQAAEKLLREAELSNLRQQLQPHFLFNSLNSISSLVGSQPEQARKMVEQLSDFLRGTIKKDANQLVLLSDEISHLNLYLEIEKVRFGHRLETDLNISDDSRQLKLPSLLLQPVVENAIKFGLYDTIGTVTISLSTKVDDGNLIIQISNPFDKESSPPRSGTGFGLNSVQRRLSLLFFRNDLLKTEQTENTFVTTLKIPQS